MHKSARPKTSSLLHSLSYVYFFIAHHGDEVGVTPDERVMMREKLVEWSGVQGDAAVAAHVEDVLAEAWAAFRPLSDEESLTELHVHARRLRQRLPDPAQRSAVLYDMAAVAKSDGHVTEGERSLVELVKKLLLEG